MVAKSRILLVSDMHYTDVVGSGALAVSNVLGATQQERLNFLNQEILREHTASPLTAVLMLGDFSVDDYPWRAKREGKANYCQKYLQTFLHGLPVPVYILPGNHDSYPDELWQKEIGCKRQYAVEIGDSLFCMLDTFHGTAVSASGAPYTGVDCVWLLEQLQLHPGKRVFLCAHYFDWSKETEKFRMILRTHSEITALFQGHTHVRRAMRLNAECGGRMLYDIGGFSYNCYCYRDAAGKECWDFNHYEAESAWGYQLLTLHRTSYEAEYVYSAWNYHGSNGTFFHPQERFVSLEESEK